MRHTVSSTQALKSAAAEDVREGSPCTRLLRASERCLAHFERIRPEHMEDSPLMAELRAAIQGVNHA